MPNGTQPPVEHTGDRPWAAVNTQSHRENIAIDNLRRQGFNCYCPRVQKQIRHARRIKDQLRPLFPGYVFVAIDGASRPWRPILSTYGVRGVVRCGDKPSLLKGEFIAELKRREVDGIIQRPSQPYKIGQQVRITMPAFEGLVATIIEMTEKDRLVVLLNLLGGPTRMLVGSAQVAE